MKDKNCYDCEHSPFCVVRLHFDCGDSDALVRKVTVSPGMFANTIQGIRQAIASHCQYFELRK